jgi:cbb3-type cytochrome oxidase subunit 1
MPVRFLKAAVVYFAIGVGLGLFMGISGNFGQRDTHAHINLLGWVSSALFALIYQTWPRLAEGAIAKTHFWLYNIGVPLMLIGLFCKMQGIDLPAPVLEIGATTVVLAVFVFAANVLGRLRAT